MTQDRRLRIRPLARLWDPPPNHMGNYRETARRALEVLANDPEGRAISAANLAMFEAAEALLEGRSPREVRKRASLLVRCQDCGGRVIAWVVWLQGRPLFLGEDSEPSYAVVSLLDDDNFAWPRYSCRRRSFQMGVEVHMSAIPAPGAPSVECRVRHEMEHCAIVK
ncbi:hypothetical protein GCM10009737_11010 [Nocardioides lentus]|uniref:Ig-like domain-containing protein n=1 Tax=Nocardioides lentus TaxID=338077 RepID=A0ABN2P594_9ACTN